MIIITDDKKPTAEVINELRDTSAVFIYDGEIVEVTGIDGVAYELRLDNRDLQIALTILGKYVIHDGVDMWLKHGHHYHASRPVIVSPDFVSFVWTVIFDGWLNARAFEAPTSKAERLAIIDGIDPSIYVPA